MNQIEKARSDHLHASFQEIARRVAAGESIVRALRKFARSRSRHLPRGKYSFGNIKALYYRWREAPTPQTLVRNYQGAQQQIPPALLLEFLNRIVQAEVISASAAFDSLQIDWRRGIALPGVGTWLQPGGRGPLHAPPFPFSRSAMADHLSGNSEREFQRLAAAALQGQRALHRFEAFLEGKRAEFSAALKHEPITQKPLCR